MVEGVRISGGVSRKPSSVYPRLFGRQRGQHSDRPTQETLGLIDCE
jgi:hypothetical protein